MGFLRRIFGPSQEEIWRQFSSEIGGEFIKGGFWQRNKVVARFKGWTITLDTDSDGESPCTRMMACYATTDGFQFSIYRRKHKGCFDDLTKRLKTRKVGYPDFDRDFIIKGNDESKVLILFDNPRIRQLIQAQPDIYILAEQGFHDEGISELYFQVFHVIKDLKRLRSLYELFTETLNHLCCIGSAITFGVSPVGEGPISQPSGSDELSDELRELMGKPAPDFELKDLSGNIVKLSKLKGKVVLLNFWTTWCGPCRNEIPHLEKIYNKYKDKGLVIFGVNDETDHNLVRNFANGKISYPILVDASSVFQIYKVREVPNNFCIDKEGLVRIQFTQSDLDQDMESKVEYYIKDLLLEL